MSIYLLWTICQYVSFCKPKQTYEKLFVFVSCTFFKCQSKTRFTITVFSNTHSPNTSVLEDDNIYDFAISGFILNLFAQTRFLDFACASENEKMTIVHFVNRWNNFYSVPRKHFHCGISCCIQVQWLWKSIEENWTFPTVNAAQNFSDTKSIHIQNDP